MRHFPDVCSTSLTSGTEDQFASTPTWLHLSPLLCDLYKIKLRMYQLFFIMLSTKAIKLYKHSVCLIKWMDTGKKIPIFNFISSKQYLYQLMYSCSVWAITFLTIRLICDGESICSQWLLHKVYFILGHCFFLSLPFTCRKKKAIFSRIPEYESLTPLCLHQVKRSSFWSWQ